MLPFILFSKKQGPGSETTIRVLTPLGEERGRRFSIYCGKVFDIAYESYPRRRIEPQFQFWVMNRLNTSNMVEDITKGFQVQISDPYLLYRNKLGEINGIWFYNQSEGEHISQLIQQYASTSLALKLKISKVSSFEDFSESFN